MQLTIELAITGVGLQSRKRTEETNPGLSFMHKALTKPTRVFRTITTFNPVSCSNEEHKRNTTEIMTTQTLPNYGRQFTKTNTHEATPEPNMSIFFFLVLHITFIKSIALMAFPTST